MNTNSHNTKLTENNKKQKFNRELEDFNKNSTNDKPVDMKKVLKTEILNL